MILYISEVKGIILTGFKLHHTRNISPSVMPNSVRCSMGSYGLKVTHLLMGLCWQWRLKHHIQSHDVQETLNQDVLSCCIWESMRVGLKKDVIKPMIFPEKSHGAALNIQLWDSSKVREKFHVIAPPKGATRIDCMWNYGPNNLDQREIHYVLILM